MLLLSPVFSCNCSSPFLKHTAIHICTPSLKKLLSNQCNNGRSFFFLASVCNHKVRVNLDSHIVLKVKVIQLCPTLCDPMDYIVHGILQSRILEWVAFLFSGGIFPGLLHCRQILYQLSHKGSPRILEWVPYPFSSGSSWPRNQTRSPALQADSLPTELSGKPRCQVCCRTEQIRNMPFRAKLFRYS